LLALNLALAQGKLGFQLREIFADDEAVPQHQVGTPGRVIFRRVCGRAQFLDNIHEQLTQARHRGSGVTADERPQTGKERMAQYVSRVVQMRKGVSNLEKKLFLNL